MPRTVGELRASGHRERGVKEEIRENLLAALAERRDVWQGILGFEDTVLPQLERALLAVKTSRPGTKHDVMSGVRLRFSRRAFIVETP